MLGDPDSCGVWAPCLTHADGLFHLVYTDVKRYGRTTVGGASGASLRDFHNYLVTSPQIDGEWSDPGVSEQQRLRPLAVPRRRRAQVPGQHAVGPPAGPEPLRRHRAAGVLDPRQRRLVGERQLIFEGTPIGFTEAPHLYKRDGYYYLLTAEGGTGWGHAVTMARRASLTGPYELHPDTYILTARHRPDAALQRAGHADLVETPDGRDLHRLPVRPARSRTAAAARWAARPRSSRWSGAATAGCAPLTAAGCPTLETPAPGAAPRTRSPAAPVREDFDGPELPIDFQWLRSPWPDELFSLTARPGSPAAVRPRNHRAACSGSRWSRGDSRRTATARPRSMDFEPAHFQQMAGLVCYYNGAKFHYLHVSHDEALGRHVRVMSALPDSPQADAFTAPIAIPHGPRRAAGGSRFRAAPLRVPRGRRRLDVAARSCSTPASSPTRRTAPGLPNFTGAFVGMACQDMAGTALPADFDWFEYREREYMP